MKKIDFAGGLELPVDAVTQTFAFMARRGAGKTYGASKLAEGMLDAGAQVVVIDPVGVWWGLRLAADGKGKGVEIPVLGGLRGDIPLEPGAGALLADLVVQRGTSAVLDVSMFRKGERKQFCTDFAEQLFHLKKSSRSPLHVFVEEAQVFVPQRVQADEARMLGAFEDLVKLGRNFGIGVTLISQRPQAVNKDALNQTECLVVLQTNGAQERKALREWIVDQGLDVGNLVDALPGLKRGEAYVWSPSWLGMTKRVHIKSKRTFNASATPEVGAKAEAPRELTPLDLEQLRTAMSATIEKAEAKDPKALQRRIAQLERELAATALHRPPVEVPIIPEATAATLERAAEAFRAAAIEASRLAEETWRTIARAKEIAGVGGLNLAPKPAKTAPPPFPATGPTGGFLGPRGEPINSRADLQASLERSAPAKVDGLSAYASHLLQVARLHHPMAFSWVQLGVLANRSHRSSTFDGARVELKRAGLVQELGRGVLELSPKGLELAGGAPTSPATPAEVQQRWLQVLPEYESWLLKVLIAEFPQGLTRAELAAKSGKSARSSSFDGAISTLKKNALVEVDADGALRATSILFMARAA